MLIPLDGGIFDSIAGLPVHPLVVHFAVVLLPLAALALILLVAVPRWADRFGGVTLATLAAGTVAAFVAKQSGEALAERVGSPGTHASWGDQLPLLAVGLLILTGAGYLLHRRDRKAGQSRSATTTIVGLLAAVLALVVTGVTVVVGHTGAQAAWGGVISPASTQPTTSAAASKAPTPSAASSPATQPITQLISRQFGGRQLHPDRSRQTRQRVLLLDRHQRQGLRRHRVDQPTPRRPTGHSRAVRQGRQFSLQRPARRPRMTHRRTEAIPDRNPRLTPGPSRLVAKLLPPNCEGPHA